MLTKMEKGALLRIIFSGKTASPKIKQCLINTMGNLHHQFQRLRSGLLSSVVIVHRHKWYNYWVKKVSRPLTDAFIDTHNLDECKIHLKGFSYKFLKGIIKALISYANNFNILWLKNLILEKNVLRNTGNISTDLHWWIKLVRGTGFCLNSQFLE